MDFLSSKEIAVPEFQDKKILFCVLNWGIGHATRSIPIIRRLALSNEIIIASDGEALKILSVVFSNMKMIELQSYNVIYSKKNNFISHLFRQVPKIVTAVYGEQIQTRKIVEENTIDIIISDNRYGCYSNKCQNFLITHQLTITTSHYFLNNFFEKTLDYLLRNFDEAWIPDDKEIQLSGDLASRELCIPKKYLGI